MMSATDTSTDDRTSRRRGRRAVWIAIGVAVAWLVVGGAVGPLSGQLNEVQTNDNASFLPANAESTLVSEEQAGFADNESFPLLVVITKPDGGALSDDDYAAVAAWAQGIPSLPVGEGTIADYLDPGQLAPFPSQDGQALLLNVPLNPDRATETIDGGLALRAITDAVRESGATLVGLSVNATGPAGILADLAQVFGAIDIQLLGATLLVVILILIVVYRSPFVWVLPITAALMANAVAGAAVYVLAKADVIVLNGQSQGILTVLVIGAATDYALLMIARYREELHHYESHTTALRVAWRGVVEPIVASGATVSIGLMCLLLSELNSNKSLGPVGAIGIIACVITLLTLLPALLAVPVVSVVLVAFLTPVLVWIALEVFGFEPPFGPFLAVGGILSLGAIVVCATIGILRARNPHTGRFSRERIPPGRWVFWPRVPQLGEADERLSGVWARLASSIRRRPRITWIVSAGVMLVLAAFTFTLKADGITTTEAFVERTDSVIGQEALLQHFPGGLGTPTIIMANESAVADVVRVTQETAGVAGVVPFTGRPGGPGDLTGEPPKVVDGRVQLLVTLSPAADSPEAIAVVADLRDRLDSVPGSDALVGGQTASQLDVDQASLRDRNLIIPVVLVVIFVILVLLLRSIAAPVLLIATVVLSYFATLGICAILFNDVFGFAGADTSFPLFAFVFLVALGVDYNIFLMTRVREESIKLGTRPGILRGLTVTGGVITSAGIVLAATFLVLAVLPLVFLRQIGIAVAIGVLLDTFVIRSTLVPALAYDIGKRVWWPSRLSKGPEPEEAKEPLPVG